MKPTFSEHHQVPSESSTAYAPPDRLIDIKEVQNLLGVGPSSIYAWTREGKLPAPIKLGSRCTRWKASAIRDFIAAQGQQT